ncbi:MAG: glucose dehydrogenase [Chloroflexi bacterium]|nr:glucose dehydrogenase [Chloroflexota bacterium]
MRPIVFALIAGLILGACSTATIEEDPTPAAGETAAPVTEPATQTAPPTATAMPTDAPEPTAQPAATDEPTAPPAPVGPEAVAVVPAVYAEGFTRPTSITHAGDGSGRLFVTEQAGLIRVIQPDGSIAGFLDIRERVGDSGNEQGLLGLAFHPDFAANGRFYINYTDTSGDTVIARYTSDGTTADPASETVLLSVAQPASNHNGGQLAFGPEGYLYIGLGDGGAQDDQFDNGQNPNTLLGTVLRIDVDSGEPYGIPPDNPFVDDPDARPEVWAFGLRNPWRFSFDRATDELYIADVGQNRYEEVNRQPAASEGGTNYGWPIMEGVECYLGECDPANYQLPIVAYSHSEGCSVTGGYVYRGQTVPGLDGLYVYGDFCSGTVWIAWNAEGRWNTRELTRIDTVSTFGEDENGELYAASLSLGTIYRLSPPTGGR